MAHESVLHHRLLWSLTEVQRWAWASVQTNKSLFPPRRLFCFATLQPLPYPTAPHTIFNILPLRLNLTSRQMAERQKWNDREGMNLWAKLSVKPDREMDTNWKRQRDRKRESKVSIKAAWSLWTMAAWVKASQKEHSSAMTDSADKGWSMKADRCADSRREALAPFGRAHYCGQTQLSGPSGPSAFYHATTLTSHTQSLSTPFFTRSLNTAFQHRNIPRPVYSTTSFWGVVCQLTGVEINLSQQFWHIDNK